MEEFGIPAGVIGSIISIVTMVVMVGFIRRLANGIIVIVFGLAAILPFTSGYYDLGFPNSYLYLYSFLLGLIAVVVTTPLWGISTIMMKSAPSNDKRVLELEKQLETLKSTIESKSQS